MPIKTFTSKVSAEAVDQACETPAVIHGRGLLAVSRDSVVSSQWLRKEAARQPRGAGVLVETLRELATRGTRTSTSGTGSGEGAGARVAVRSVLEDHETAILELERQVCEVECLVNHVKTLEQLVMQLQHTTSETRDVSRTVAELGTKLEGAGNAEGGGGLEQQFHRVGGRPRAAC